MRDDECKVCGTQSHLLPGGGWRCKKCGLFNEADRTETERINRDSITKYLREDSRFRKARTEEMP